MVESEFNKICKNLEKFKKFGKICQNLVKFLNQNLRKSRNLDQNHLFLTRNWPEIKEKWLKSGFWRLIRPYGPIDEPISGLGYGHTALHTGLRYGLCGPTGLGSECTRAYGPVLRTSEWVPSCVHVSCVGTYLHVGVYAPGVCFANPL